MDYTEIDEEASKLQEKGDSEVEVLELIVGENTINWRFSRGRTHSDEATLLASDQEALILDSLTRATINFLVEQMQLLAGLQRTTDNENAEVSGALDKLIKILGTYLYRVLFRGKIQEKLDAALRRGDLDLLRVQLELEHNMELAKWPWEYLYRQWDGATGGGEFLARITQLVLNRRLLVDKSIQAQLPVKILFVVSRPEDLGVVLCAPVLNEIRKLQEQNVVKLRGLIEDKVTRQAFRKAVRDFQPNIIHFIGHGRLTSGGGEVAFVNDDEEGHADWVQAEVFADWVARSKHLKLVFLQACESAISGPYGLSLAMRLAHRNIPAVVAMQDKVDNTVASTFASSFYEALAQGLSVDQAVKEGRDAVAALRGGMLYAFGVPVLYLSSYQSLIVQESASDRRPTNDLSERDPLKPSEKRHPCPSCGKSIKEESRACSYCGLHFYCSFCKKRLDDPLGDYCNWCGGRLRCDQCRAYRDDPESPLCRACRNRTSELSAIGDKEQPLAGVS